MALNSPLINRILEEIPEYADASARLARLKKLPPITSSQTFDFSNISRASSITEGTSVAPLVVGSSLIDLVADESAKVTAASLIKMATAAEHHHAAVQAARAGIQFAREELENRLNNIKLDSSAVIISGLQRRLTTVLEELRALRPLHQIVDAREAIACGRADDVARLEQAAASYQQIRQAQWAVRRRYDSSVILTDYIQYPEVMVIRNIEKVFPLWAPWRASGGYLIRRNGGDIKTIRPPWIDVPDTRDYSGMGFQDSIDRDTQSLGFLVWAIKSGADLWLPRMGEYENEVKRLNRDVYTNMSARHAATAKDPDWEDPAVVNHLDAIDRGSMTGSEARNAFADRQRQTNAARGRAMLDQLPTY